jgi:predicted ribosome-associated RNA-binding protein Tma20
MKKIRTYSDILESYKRYNMIYEKSMNSEKLKQIKRLKDSGDLKSLLKELNSIVFNIKNEFMIIDFDDIQYSYDNDIVDFTYSDEIYPLLLSLKYKTKKSNDDIDERIFGGGWKDISLQIELDRDMFNRIDIINGLPNFMKGIGLGKKIYKKLIKDFNYISTFDGYEPSIDSSMVWQSLANDDDIFTFTNGENIICFWNDYSYNHIIEKLKYFYKDSDFNNDHFDDTFLKKYKLSDVSLGEILFKSN